MIDTELFKDALERGVPYHTLLILTYSDNKFVAEQYAKQIAINNGYPFEVVETIDDLFSSIGNVFGDKSLKVLTIDKLQTEDTFLTKVKDAVIIANKIEKETSKLFNEYILEIPKLETWQVEDYAIAQLDGVRESDICSLVGACDSDIYRVDNEVAKLKIFNAPNRQYLYSLFTEKGAFPTTEKYTIFSLSNALITKTKESVCKILAHIDEIDVNPIGLLTILYKNVANVIAIQLNPKATPENTGMTSGQFYAIKKNNLNFYSANQLIKIFNFLTALDLKIKTGEVPMEIVIPYIVEYMLGAQ